MKFSPKENHAIVKFLEALNTEHSSREDGERYAKRAEEKRKWLFERTRREPERVLAFLESLGEAEERKNPLLRELRMIAADAYLRRK